MTANQNLAVHHHLIAHAKKAGNLATGTARLTYYIYEGVLVGFIEGAMVHLTAWSGGAGGSRKNKSSNSANNPYMYSLKEVEADKHHHHVHGGPIPPGLYQIYRPSSDPKLGHCAKLRPMSSDGKDRALPNNRDGFAIHGSGPHGSDGCIVLRKDKKDDPEPHIDDLTPLLEKLTASNGGKLIVLQAMEGVFA